MGNESSVEIRFKNMWSKLHAGEEVTLALHFTRARASELVGQRDCYGINVSIAEFQHAQIVKSLRVRAATFELLRQIFQSICIPKTKIIKASTCHS